MLVTSKVFLESSAVSSSMTFINSVDMSLTSVSISLYNADLNASRQTAWKKAWSLKLSFLLNLTITKLLLSATCKRTLATFDISTGILPTLPLIFESFLNTYFFKWNLPRYWHLLKSFQLFYCGRFKSFKLFENSLSRFCR